MLKTNSGPKALYQQFFHWEPAGGLALALAALLAILLNNLDNTSALYNYVLDFRLSLNLGLWSKTKPVLLWINDALMVLFFFMVGLEIKREFLTGELSDRTKIAMPIAGALGGMIGPAIVFFAVIHFSRTDLSLYKGWPIPTATDIAFALAVLSLLGRRVPKSLKVFLLTLAIVDDIGAIALIAILFTDAINMMALLGAAIAAGLLLWCNRRSLMVLPIYGLIGCLLWITILEAGLHPTLAGVITAFAIPGKNTSGDKSPLVQVAEGLHPWITFLILPIFALANAGFSLEGLTFSSLAGPLSAAISLALIIGKPIGILLVCFMLKKYGWGDLPKDVTWRHLSGVGFLAGIGFTMSLFIGALAFPDLGIDTAAAIRLGVLCGSFVSATLGFFILYASLPRSIISTP